MDKNKPYEEYYKDEIQEAMNNEAVNNLSVWYMTGGQQFTESNEEFKERFKKMKEKYKSMVLTE